MHSLTKLLLELTNNQVATATSLGDATMHPGTICQVDEESYFEFLEMLPPRWMQGGCFAFAEGDSPYLLFWQHLGRFYARQLTSNETARLVEIAGVKPA